MPLIERRRKHAKIKERQRQIELEEKQARVNILLYIAMLEFKNKQNLSVAFPLFVSLCRNWLLTGVKLVILPQNFCFKRN